MIRVLFYVILVFLLAIGFAWLADRPGAIVLTWQDSEIRTSLMVAAVALIALIVVLALLGEAVRSIVKAPDMLGRFLGTRRRERGYRALSTGLVAVGAGDARTARRAADESTALLGEAPMTLLLTAQAAQLAGDADRARKTFEALAARDDTRVLGLHGLFVEARRDNNHEAARHFAEEAVRAVPAAGWAGTALFEYQARAGDWLGALRTLAANADAKVLDKARAKRLRAELLTARAMELEAGDPTEARALAQEAHRLAPELVPAATVAARLLTRADEIRRAVKVLETTWKAAAHPEIADAYAVVRPGDSFRDRLKRMRRLADMRTGDPEGAMAIARLWRRGRWPWRLPGRHRRARLERRARRARPPRRRDAQRACLPAHGRDRGARRRRPGPRAPLADARADGAARSRLGGRRPRLPSLGAGLAGLRPRRRLRLEDHRAAAAPRGTGDRHAGTGPRASAAAHSRPAAPRPEGRGAAAAGGANRTRET